jgi:hypothetical protein
VQFCPHVAALSPIAGTERGGWLRRRSQPTMDRLQTWIDELNPLASLTSIAFLFLIAIIAGWYVGNLIQWFRR